MFLCQTQLFPVTFTLNQRGHLKVASSAVIGDGFCLVCVPSWWPARVIRHNASVTPWDYITLCMVCVSVSLSANQSDGVRSSVWRAEFVPVGFFYQICTLRGEQPLAEEIC